MSRFTSRRNASVKGNPVSLFPFLAVLLCTMGSLLGVLLLMADLAKKQIVENTEIVQEKEPRSEDVVLPTLTEDSSSNQPTAQQVEDEIQQKQKILAQIEQKKQEIQRIQSELDSKLTASRLHLCGAESDLKKLEQELEQLRREQELLDGQLEQVDTAFLKAKSEQMDSELANKKRELEGVKEKNRETKPGLAVIPHKGQYNTNRYPIYVICTKSGVILQPEGIVLSEADFACNLSLGSPLEAAMRTKREYLLKQGAFDPTRDGEPYPLILVRPDGIEYYYAARAAISAFGNDFGYKLLDSKQADELVYPPVDPDMTFAMQQAVDRTRVNMREIAKSAPAMEASPQGPIVYRVSGSGSREAVSLDQGSRVAEVLRNSRSTGRSGGNTEPTVVTGNPPYGNGYGYNSNGNSNVNGTTNGTCNNGAGGYAIGSLNNGSSQIVVGSPNNGGTAQAGNQNDYSGLETGSNLGLGTPSGNGQAGSSNSGTVAQNNDGWTNTSIGTGGGQNGNRVYLSGSAGGVGGDVGEAQSIFGGIAEAEQIDPSENVLLNNPLMTGTGQKSNSSGNSNGTGQGTQSALAYSQNIQNGQAGTTQGVQQNPLLEQNVQQWQKPQDNTNQPQIQASQQVQVGQQAQSGQTCPNGQCAANGAMQLPPGMKPSLNGTGEPIELSKHQKSLAQRLGPNWAVPELNTPAISISRAVRVEVYPDSFVVQPVSTSEKPVRLPIYGETINAVEGLIRTVRGQTSAWGDPGMNSYWKPYLKLSPQPGSESRVADLREALKDSGVEIE